MSVGRTPNCPASSLTVRSPLRAAKATWALNAAVCCFRLPFIVPPFLGHLSSLAGGPVFGVHYNDEDAEGARSLLDEGVQGTVEAAMPTMPPGDPWPAIRVVLRAEAALRAGIPLDEQQVNSLNPYWQDLVRLLRVFRHFRNGEFDAVSRIKNEMTDKFYREYIAMKEKPR